MAHSHADGSKCFEGSKRVPSDYVACCDSFAGHVTTCHFDVRYEYWEKQDIWVIAIDESAGGGGIEITFCPHCGKKLKVAGNQ